MNESATPKVWLLLGKKAGDNNQVLALAEQLGWPWESKHIVNRPTELISNLLLPVTLLGIDRKGSSPLAPPWPDLIISSGRRNEPVARWIRQQSGGRSRLVHIGRPWAPLANWDLIVTTPQYFLPESDNILHNQLPLHRISPDQLSALKNDHPQPWSHLPRPYTAVLLGGDSGPFVFTGEKGERLGKLVNELAQARGGSLLVTDSRRTPTAASEGFWSTVETPAFRHSWRDGSGHNPYRHYLAMADRFVVTGESMSMLAEARSTGKPLYIFDLADQEPWWTKAHNYGHKPLSHRLAMAWGPLRMRRDISRIQDSLVKTGGACWLEEWQGFAESQSDSSVINEAAMAAARVTALFRH